MKKYYFIEWVYKKLTMIFLNIEKPEQHEHDDQMKSKSKTFIRCY